MKLTKAGTVRLYENGRFGAMWAATLTVCSGADSGPLSFHVLRLVKLPSYELIDRKESGGALGTVPPSFEPHNHYRSTKIFWAATHNSTREARIKTDQFHESFEFPLERLHAMIRRALQLTRLTGPTVTLLNQIAHVSHAGFSQRYF